MKGIDENNLTPGDCFVWSGSEWIKVESWSAADSKLIYGDWNLTRWQRFCVRLKSVKERIEQIAHERN